jgi:hypothetical protein
VAGVDDDQFLFFIHRLPRVWYGRVSNPPLRFLFCSGAGRPSPLRNARRLKHDAQIMREISREGVTLETLESIGAAFEKENYFPG